MNDTPNQLTSVVARAWKAIVVAFTPTRRSGESKDFEPADTTMLGGLAEQAPASRTRASRTDDGWNATGESSYFADDNAPRSKRR